MKKSKGFTLIESLVVMTIAAVSATAFFNYMSDRAEKERVDILATDIGSVINGFDKRVTNDKFLLSDWNQFSGSSYEFGNRTQVSDFLSKALIAKDAPGCGKIDGWEPKKDDPVDEAYKDKFRFIDCSLWNSKISFDLESQAEIKNDGTYVTGFQIDFFFSNNADFEDNFLSFNKVLSKIKADDSRNTSGIHHYEFVDITNDAALSSKECIDKLTDCAIRASFTGSSNAQESLQVNGNNNMIGSKVKFQEDIGDTAMNTCHRYTESGGVWSRVDNVYCGIGFGYSNPADITSAKLDYVEVAATSITTNKIFLDKMCDFRDSGGTLKSVPCGVYHDEGANKVIASYDEVYATDALVNVLEAQDLKTIDATVRNTLTVDGQTDLFGDLTVDGLATFNDLVEIKGNATDTNLIVETSASLKDTDVDGNLTVDGKATVSGDVNIAGSLNIGNKLTTQRLKLNQSITASDLGDSCSTYGNGTMVYFSAGTYSDMAVCANNKWKLVNTQLNQIVAFNGSCPTGFTKFTQAEGRTLMGAGSLYDSASGSTMSYSVGDTGGEASHVLSVAEMPAHDHNYMDVVFMEHWGDTGAKNMVGSNGGQDTDNNWYTRDGVSEVSGNNQAHENRMPYYVVNWCQYTG